MGYKNNGHTIVVAEDKKIKLYMDGENIDYTIMEAVEAVNSYLCMLLYDVLYTLSWMSL